MQSPCRGICKINSAQDMCIGCYRTSREIAQWHDMEEALRKSLMLALKLRKMKLGQLKEG